MNALSFSVTGEFLTNFARDLVLSEDCDRAEKFLLESLHGASLAEVHQILMGSQRLIGTNEVEMVEDPDPQEYQEDVKYIYAGRTRLNVGGNSSWWRPVAYWRWTSRAIGVFKAHEEEQWGAGRQFNSDFHPENWVLEQQGKPGEIVRLIPWDEEIMQILTRYEPEKWLYSYSWEQIPVFYQPCDAPPPWLKAKALAKTPLISFAECLVRLEAREMPSLREAAQDAREPQIKRIITKPSSEYQECLYQTLVPPLPVWDGKASLAKAPSFSFPSITDVLAQMREGISPAQKEHAYKQICLQADESGWMDFPWGDKKLRVPKGAFECWSLRYYIPGRSNPLEGYEW